MTPVLSKKRESEIQKKGRVKFISDVLAYPCNVASGSAHVMPVVTTHISVLGEAPLHRPDGFDMRK